MALPNKRPHLALETPENTESSSSSEGTDEEDSYSDEGGNQMEVPSTGDHELQVEFEARTPESCDYHGISRLLQQTFRKCEDLNFGAMTDFIIAQRFIGSVITQSRGGGGGGNGDNDDDDDEEEDEDDEFEDLQNEVFGMMTLVRLGEEASVTSNQITSYLKTILVSDGGSKNGSSNGSSSGTGDVPIFLNLLSDKNNNFAFIISERIINIPAQISVPLYETLLNEIKKAKARSLPFNFTHFVIITKLITNDKNGKAENIFINAEEEIVLPECDLAIDIKDKEPVYRSDLSADTQSLERRKILVFKANKMEKIVHQLRNAFPIP